MKIKIEKKLRAATEAAIAEISAVLKRETDRSEELERFRVDAGVAKKDLEKLSAKFRIGDDDTAEQIEKRERLLKNGRQRAMQLNAISSDTMRQALDVFRTHVSTVQKCGYDVRDALILDIEEMLLPIFGREEAARLAEFSTPVRILNEMIRGRFEDGSNESSEVFGRLSRMVAFVTAVLKGEWDPFKWAKTADALQFLNLQQEIEASEIPVALLNDGHANAVELAVSAQSEADEFSAEKTLSEEE